MLYQNIFMLFALGLMGFAIYLKVSVINKIHTNDSDQEEFVFGNSYVIAVLSIGMLFSISLFSVYRVIKYWDYFNQKYVEAYPVILIAVGGLPFLVFIFTLPYLNKLRSYKLVVDKEKITEINGKKLKNLEWNQIVRVQNNELIGNNGVKIKPKPAIENLRRLQETILQRLPSSVEMGPYPIRFGSPNFRVKHGLYWASVAFTLIIASLAVHSWVIGAIELVPFGFMGYWNWTKYGSQIQFVEISEEWIKLGSLKGISLIQISGIETVNIQGINTGTPGGGPVLRTKDGIEYKILADDPVAVAYAIRKIIV